MKITSQDLMVPTSIVGERAGRGIISWAGSLRAPVAESARVGVRTARAGTGANRARRIAKRRADTDRPRRNILSKFWKFSIWTFLNFFQWTEIWSVFK